ncbi:tryptophan synthase subunit beta like protein [Parahaliea maris]|uniref:Tryptophan synthase subunit beta like protein n=1 Tax=Parahaliea maris TaxID=2716870 RepID=A0A5C8ZMS8_9GAMM|nr:tryptophan synthase subunit beta like protein [Parahaliea maris]TXS88939.1 tryptophan synthase subunit beta like protein [Parahaliea maris]
MPFVLRDDSGAIVTVSQLPTEGYEAVASDDPDLHVFLATAGGDALQISATDQDFVRVLEDVVELLVAKGVILFTDLPQSAQDKMLHRQRLRSHMTGKLDLIGDD